NGPVGTNADTVQITGNLALTGGSGSYVLSVISLMANNNPGDVGAGGGATFAESIRSWDILTTTGTITGFDAANWTLDTSGFSPSFAGSWAIDINGAGNALVLTYVPEPTCMAMVLLGGAGLLFRRRK
ncbi:MAG TPA: PEP-CTERM sorting domain-containing protein, partial [Candidatus Hydrogenedentes bacterium]|nr:PEP-CTERM sorting domain-containing protein [Candidatus Hydrogenedentota bacterium]